MAEVRPDLLQRNPHDLTRPLAAMLDFFSSRVPADVSHRNVYLGLCTVYVFEWSSHRLQLFLYS